MALELILRSKSPSWRMTALSSTLAGVLVPFGLVQAMGLERIAAPVTTGAGDAIGLRVKEAGERLACVDTVLDRGTMSCPQDCMIPTNQLGMTNADSCVLAVAGNWQCRWPTQWVTEQENCNNLGYGGGWTGTATVRREYQIQQCGQVVTRTGAPLQLIETSQCNRVGNEPRSVACPDRANASLASDIGGAVGALWTQATSHETDWSGSVGLQRSYNEGLTTQGQIVRLSSGDWSVAPGGVACTRTIDRQVKVPCMETIPVATTSCNEAGSCATSTQNVLIGDTDHACLTDYRANSITYSAGLSVNYGGLPYGGAAFLRKGRDWSYTAPPTCLAPTVLQLQGPITVAWPK
jgi:hypothetical protein